MPANLESMFFKGQLPWHQRGVKIPDDKVLSIEEGIIASGLNFGIRKEELFTADGKKAPCFATVREDRNEILGWVGPSYEVLDNIDAFKWFQPFLDAGACELHTAGSLFGGRKIWILAEILKDPIEITPDDVVQKFVMLSNSHDGTSAVRVGFTGVRIVCANTLAMAHNDENSKLIRFRHSASLKGNLEAVRDTMALAEEEFRATAEQYKKLLNTHISQRDVAKYVVKTFKMEDEEGKISTRAKNQLERIMELVNTGYGNTDSKVEGTLWQAYNGLNQYLNYEHGRNEDSRLNNLWFSQSNDLNQRALNLALQLAG